MSADAEAEAGRPAEPSRPNVEPSRRTSEHPMAFTRWEFWRGAFAALGWYLLGVLVVSVIAGGPSTMTVIVITVAVCYAVPFGIAAMIVFSPLAWLIGRALRRTSRMTAHVVAFVLLGGVVGLATMSVFMGGTGWGGSGDVSASWMIAAYGAPALVAVPLGWWFTARRALRSDRGSTPVNRQRHDADAEFEDAA